MTYINYETDDIEITLKVNDEKVTHMECRAAFENVLRGIGYVLQYNPGDYNE